MCFDDSTFPLGGAPEQKRVVGPIIAKPMGSNSPFKPLIVSLLEFYSSKNESTGDRGREIKFGPLVYGEVDNLSSSLHHGVLLSSWLVFFLFFLFFAKYSAIKDAHTYVHTLTPIDARTPYAYEHLQKTASKK
jgi:hypothetical protein